VWSSMLPELGEHGQTLAGEAASNSLWSDKGGFE
jgi:hypothetical protein